MPTRDFPFAYTRDMEGYWNAPDGATVAHEVGHAMGLGEDYFVMADENEKRVLTGQKAEPELGEANSIMRDSGLRPDAIMVFRIIEQMQEAGVLPNCAREVFTYYLWDGVVKKEFTQQEHDELQIDAAWSAEFHVKFAQVPTITGGSSPTRTTRFRVSTSIRSIPWRSITRFCRATAKRCPAITGSRWMGLRKAVCVATGF